MAEQVKNEELESLEEIMEKLSLTVAKLESEKLSLEDSFACFSEGIQLVMKGNQAIDKVEKEMKTLIAGEEMTSEFYE